MEWQVTPLPHPDSPTDEGFALVQMKLTPSTALTNTARVKKLGFKV